MTRHALMEDFDSRDLMLSKGELVIVLENERSGERSNSTGIGDRYQGNVERSVGYHVMVKTRHGRKVRVPRHILSKEMVVFNCQLCSHQVLPTYREYVDHMIDKHLRVQLLKGLDMTKKQPTCPFPSCQGMTWPIVDNLLFHYASHHNVLEKVIMYESEVAAEGLRVELKKKDVTIEGLFKEVREIKKGSMATRMEGVGTNVDRPMDLLSDAKTLHQLKEEVDLGKQKLKIKSTVIKTLKDEVMELKRSLKSCSKRYEDVVKFNVSIQNELDMIKGNAAGDSKQEGANCDDGSNSKCGPQTNDAEIMDLKARLAKLQSELDGKGEVSSSGESLVTISTQTEISLISGEINMVNNALSSSLSVEEEDLQSKVSRLSKNNEVCVMHINSLKLEIENINSQNENMKNIIEIGKTTVETAKKINKDLVDDNKSLKDKESLYLEELRKLESEVSQLKSEPAELCNQPQQPVVKTIEGVISKATDVSRYGVESVHYPARVSDTKVLAVPNSSTRDDLKQKLLKCRENCRVLEEAKKTLEKDFKVLVTENKNAATEIKTLKNHLSSNRAIVVEKAVAKDELVTVKAELAAKTSEFEKSSVKLKKLGNELHCVLNELKQSKDAKKVVDNELKMLKEKMKVSSSQLCSECKQDGLSKEDTKTKDEVIKLHASLRSLEAEMNTLRRDKEGLIRARNELQERMEFYVGQCTEFERNDSQLQDEISSLQNNIKQSAVDQLAKIEILEKAIGELNGKLAECRENEEILVGENGKLREEILHLKLKSSRGYDDDEIVLKYKLKCDMVDELLKKHEKIAAQLRRKDWEIDNYQKKLDTTFEAELMNLAKDGALYLKKDAAVCSSPPALGDNCYPLDLSTRKSDLHEPNNNDMPVTFTVPCTSTPILNESRKISESSSVSQQDNTPSAENLDLSFDSSSTCPSEAATFVSQPATRRKRTMSMGGIPPKKKPYVRIDCD